MMRRRANKAAVYGALVGTAHFIAICGLAIVVVRGQHTGNSQEYWQYAGLFDLPVSLALLLLTPLLNLLSGVADWPDVTFLPGIIGSWNRFLFPFFLYGVLGSAIWFLLGWGFIRLTRSRNLP